MVAVGLRTMLLLLLRLRHKEIKYILLIVKTKRDSIVSAHVILRTVNLLTFNCILKPIFHIVRYIHEKICITSASDCDICSSH